MNPKALPLAEYINETPLPAKYRFEIITNLINLYTQPFSMDIVEEIFEFPEVIVGSNDKGEVDWSDWKVSENLYVLSNHPDKEPCQLTPRTVSDFIEDCNRVWNIDLLWEPNLMKRYFRYEH